MDKVTRQMYLENLNKDKDFDYFENPRQVNQQIFVYLRF